MKEPFRICVRNLGINKIVNNQVVEDVNDLLKMFQYYKKSGLVSSLTHDFQVLEVHGDGPMLAGNTVESCIKWCENKLGLGTTNVECVATIDVVAELDKILVLCDEPNSTENIKEIAKVLKYILSK